MARKETWAHTPAEELGRGCAWIDGSYVPMSEARISILDAGFLRSDLTYDVVAVWKGKFFRLENHLDRFEKGCTGIRVRPPLARDQMRQILIEVVRRSGLRDAYVEMIVSRGIPSPGQRDLRRFAPQFFAYAIPYQSIVGLDEPGTGTDVVVARDVRRTPPDAIDPTVKNFQWGDFTRGILEAYDRRAWLPILTDGDGKLTEGPGFNVFVVADRILHTPARGVLEGITRRTVMEIAAEVGLDVEVHDVPTSMIYRAAEIFLTSTAGGVVPVATLDGEAVGNECPGPITGRILETYWAWHDDPRFATPVAYDR